MVFASGAIFAVREHPAVHSEKEERELDVAGTIKHYSANDGESRSEGSATERTEAFEPRTGKLLLLAYFETSQ